MNKQSHTIVAGENYIEIGKGLLPTTRHQYYIPSDEEFNKLKEYLEKNYSFIKCF